MQSEEEKEYIAYYASRTEPEGWYTEKEKRIIQKEPRSLGWRIVVMILFWPYAIYRSWRGVNQANKLLAKRQSLIQEKQKKGEKLTEEEKRILNEEKIGGLYKFLSLMIPPIYSIYRGVLGVKDENTLIELKKDEIIKKNKNKYTRVRVKASQIKNDPNWVIEQKNEFSQEQMPVMDTKINQSKEGQNQIVTPENRNSINGNTPSINLTAKAKTVALCTE